MAFHVLGGEAEDYCLRYDEETGNYEYDEGLEMDLTLPS